MELQHVNVKLQLADESARDLATLIPVFHSWIQDQIFGELLLDIADYRHVPAGPGIVIIGQDGDFSVDDTDGLLGVRYNRKKPLQGSNQDRLRQAARAALTACTRLETEARLGGKFKFGGRRVEVFINDRLLAPNTDATHQASGAELDVFFKKLFGGSSFALAYESDPRRRFSVAATIEQPLRLSQLISNLNAA
jgi:hypothetical protein